MSRSGQPFARIATSLLFLVSGLQKIVAPRLMTSLFLKLRLPAMTGLAVGFFEVAAAGSFLKIQAWRARFPSLRRLPHRWTPVDRMPEARRGTSRNGSVVGIARSARRHRGSDHAQGVGSRHERFGAVVMPLAHHG